MDCGRSSTVAQAMETPATLVTDSAGEIGSTPALWYHVIIDMDTVNAPDAKAADPSMLFLPPGRHL